MAAPITNPTPNGAAVFDLTHARRRAQRSGPTPQEVREERARAERRARDMAAPDVLRVQHEAILAELDQAQAAADQQFLSEFLPAVERALRADLATWPAAFRRRLDSFRGPWPHHHALERNPKAFWESWKSARESGTKGTTMDEHACVCGCVGFHDALAQQLRRLRDAARELRESRGRKAFVRARRREKLEEEQRDLLDLMWRRGVRRIDRKAQREHLAEALDTEVRRSREAIKSGRALARYAQERLRKGVREARSKRDPRAGKPLTTSAVAGFERDLRAGKERARRERALLAELEGLEHDPAALVRQWTGCAREPRLVFARGHFHGYRLEGLREVRA